MKYYSTFPIGFLSIVEEILLKQNNKMQVISKGENYLYYSTSLNKEDIERYDFFEQSFYIIKFFDKKNFQFKNQINWIKSNANILQKELNILGKNKKYRIVGTAGSLGKEKIQEQINTINGMVNIDNSNPDYDIRIVEKGDHGFIGVRITKPREHIDDFQKDSLRKEIAYYMIYLSEVEKDDVFLDPFCGGGVIPLLRSKIGEYKKIICSDIDTTSLKSKLRRVGDISNLEIVESNINNLNLSVNKIVTDPPWGFIQDIEDLKEFYFNMLDKFYNLTASNSIMILLAPHLEIIEEYVRDNSKKFVLCKTYKGKVSGRYSYIIKLNRV